MTIEWATRKGLAKRSYMYQVFYSVVVNVNKVLYTKWTLLNAQLDTYLLVFDGLTLGVATDYIASGTLRTSRTVCSL